MEIQNTLFVVECTLAEILRRAKIGREKFALKIMSWYLPMERRERSIFIGYDLTKTKWRI